MLSFSCAAQKSNDSILIDNVVSECITFKKSNIEVYGNIILLNTEWEVRNNIGECGCKSAALKYEVKTENNQSISQGMFSTINREKLQFVINTDSSLFKKLSYTLIINCK